MSTPTLNLLGGRSSPTSRILYPEGDSGPATQSARGVTAQTQSPFGAVNRTTARATGVPVQPNPAPQTAPVSTTTPQYATPAAATPTTPTTPGGGSTAPNPYAPATNAFKPYTLYDGQTPYTTSTPGVYGAPVVNPDGSVSAARPDSFGAFGFDPYMNWSGVNSDTGQPWNIGNNYLNDQGAQKLIELLGLGGAPIKTTPGSVQDWTRTPGAIYSPTSGNNSGPQGQGMWRYVDPATNQLVDLSAYAPYFISGQDDIGKFLFENVGNPQVQQALQYLIPSQYNNVDEFQNAVQSTTSALQNPVIPTAGGGSVPAGGGTGNTGNTGNTGGNTGSGGTSNNGRGAIDSLIQLLQGIYQGSNPFTIEQLLGGGTLGSPGAPFGQNYLDGLSTLSNFANLGDNILGLLTPKDLFDVSPTGMYSQFGPAAYLQRQLYPDLYM